MKIQTKIKLQDKQSKKYQWLIYVTLVILTVTSVTQCAVNDAPVEQEVFPLTGTWVETTQAVHVITETTWEVDGSQTPFPYTSSSTIHEFDLTNSTFISQNSASASFNPSKFFKNVWVKSSDSIYYYCTILEAKNTIEEARIVVNNTDSATPDSSGCGGFAWTKLTVQ